MTFYTRQSNRWLNEVQVERREFHDHVIDCVQRVKGTLRAASAEVREVLSARKYRLPARTQLCAASLNTLIPGECIRDLNDVNSHTIGKSVQNRVVATNRCYQAKRLCN